MFPPNTLMSPFSDTLVVDRITAGSVVEPFGAAPTATEPFRDAPRET
jgi:hypothetical protein